MSKQINFRLVGYQWECPGGDSDAFNLLINVEDCAQYCFGKATQFVFGTSNPAAKHCDRYGRCDCRCIVNDTLDQTCTVMNGTIGYNLYRFSKYIFWNPYLPNMVYFDSLCRFVSWDISFWTLGLLEGVLSNRPCPSVGPSIRWSVRL